MKRDDTLTPSELRDILTSDPDDLADVPNALRSLVLGLREASPEDDAPKAEFVAWIQAAATIDLAIATHRRMIVAANQLQQSRKAQQQLEDLAAAAKTASASLPDDPSFIGGGT